MADSLGFHTHDFAKNFVSACTSILGVQGTLEAIEHQGRVTRVTVCPTGIDSERFTRAIELPKVQKLIKEFKDDFFGKKVILSVERLDTIKGITLKLLAFEKFLEKNRQWRDKVALLQIGVPSRSDIPIYKKLKTQVDEIVGRVNARYGSLDSVPILYLDHSIDFYPQICTCHFYESCQPEFVACQDSKKTVLVLSEFAGAAQALGSGAITVNPWNSAAIGQALDMPAEERDKRHRVNLEYVTTHTAQQWAHFIRGNLKLK